MAMAQKMQAQRPLELNRADERFEPAVFAMQEFLESVQSLAHKAQNPRFADFLAKFHEGEVIRVSIPASNGHSQMTLETREGESLTVNLSASGTHLSGTSKSGEQLDITITGGQTLFIFSDKPKNEFMRFSVR